MTQTKTVLRALIGVAGTLLIAFFMVAMFLAFYDAFTHPQKAQASPAINALTDRQQAWLAALRWQESWGNDLAINPKDSDGTPSYGRYQFKPYTFDAYGRKYGIIRSTPIDVPATSTLVYLIEKPGPSPIADVMNPVLQQEIMEDMVVDKSITTYEWRHQLFPGSIAKIGLPPLSPLLIAVHVVSYQSLK